MRPQEIETAKQYPNISLYCFHQSVSIAHTYILGQLTIKISLHHPSKVQFCHSALYIFIYFEQIFIIPLCFDLSYFFLHCKTWPTKSYLFCKINYTEILLRCIAFNYVPNLEPYASLVASIYQSISASVAQSLMGVYESILYLYSCTFIFYCWQWSV